MDYVGYTMSINTTTMTFADYKASLPKAQEQEDDILRYTYALAEAMRQDYIAYAIRNCKLSLMGANSDLSVDHYAARLSDLMNGYCDMYFTVESARKFHKVWNQDQDGSHRSIAFFVDKKTGDVYKPASIKAPAKGVRYRLLDETSREEAMKRADWSGAYLYKV